MAIALREKTEAVPDTPTDKDNLIRELSTSVSQLSVFTTLEAYRQTVQLVKERGASPNAHYFLMHLIPSEQKIRVLGFKKTDLQAATNKYQEIEREIADKPGTQAVLVSVHSLKSLHKTYPNYFLDARVFLGLVNDVLAGHLLSA